MKSIVSRIEFDRLAETRPQRRRRHSSASISRAGSDAESQGGAQRRNAVRPADRVTSRISGRRAILHAVPQARWAFTGAISSACPVILGRAPARRILGNNGKNPLYFPKTPYNPRERIALPSFERSVTMHAQTQKVALITGGSRGLGRNTAESLARRGVDVVITYHSRVDEACTVVAAIETQGRKAVALQIDGAAVATFDVRGNTQERLAGNMVARSFRLSRQQRGHLAPQRVREDYRGRGGRPLQHQLQRRVFPHAEAPAASSRMAAGSSTCRLA